MSGNNWSWEQHQAGSSHTTVRHKRQETGSQASRSCHLEDYFILPGPKVTCDSGVSSYLLQTNRKTCHECHE